MVRNAFVVVLAIIGLLARPSVVSAHEQNYLNAHCGAAGVHDEGREGFNGWASASLTLTSAQDPYSQCGYIKVRMYYKYYGAGGREEISYLQDTAYPGNYPYSPDDDRIASVYTGVSSRVIGCNHVDYIINVGGPGGPTKTWSHLC